MHFYSMQSSKYLITESILFSTRYQSLAAFSSVYGIGPTTARRLYSLGLRSIEHLERYYEVEPGTEDNTSTQEMIGDMGTEDGSGNTDKLTEISIKVGLALRSDFDQK